MLKIRFIIIELKHIFYGLISTQYMTNLLSDEMVGKRLRYNDTNSYKTYLKEIARENETRH